MSPILQTGFKRFKQNKLDPWEVILLSRVYGRLTKQFWGKRLSHFFVGYPGSFGIIPQKYKRKQRMV